MNMNNKINLLEKQLLLICTLCTTLTAPAFAAPTSTVTQQSTAPTQPTGALSPKERAQANIESGRELYHSGNWLTAQEAFTNAYNDAPENSTLKAEATFELAGVLWEQGEYAQAYKRVKEAIQRAKKLNLNKARPQLYLRQAHIEAARGNFGNAFATFQLCINSAIENGDVETTALCKIAQRATLMAQGKNPGSEASYQKDLNTLKSTKDPQLVGVSLAKIAELQENAGNYTGAMALLQQAQSEFEKSGSVPAIAQNQLKIAGVFQALERWSDAKKEIEDLEITFKNMNNRPALVNTYNLYAAIKEHEGDGNAAFNYMKQALRYAAAIASPQLQALTRLNICEFFARTEKPEQGIFDCKIARSVFIKGGMRTLATRAIIAQSRLEQNSGKFKESAESYKTSIQELSKMPATKENQKELMAQKTNLCSVSSQIDNQSAIENCTSALKTFDENPSKDPATRQMLVQTLLRLGLAEQEGKQPDRALSHLQRLTSIADPKEDKLALANAYLTLSTLPPNDPNKEIQSIQETIKLVSSEPNATTTGHPFATLNINAKTALAQTLSNQQKWDDAAPAFKQVVEVAKKLQDWNRVAWAYLGLARTYQAKNNTAEAQKALKTGLPFAEKGGDSETIQEYKKHLK